MSKKVVGDYVLSKKLGHGSFATVFRATHVKHSDKVVAIKAISTSRLNQKLQANLESEIGILDKLAHPNIVRLFGIHKTAHHLYLVMEYCEGGDLHRYIRKNKRLDVLTVKRFMSQIAQGMSYLWSKSLIHRDLKPQNILLSMRSSDAVLKIADFGFARHLAVAAMAETLCGSPLYMAPEILRYHKYDAKADLWSAGTILFEMLAGRPPFEGANPPELLRNIERTEFRIPEDIAVEPACAELLEKLLKRNPVERLSFQNFFNSPFLEGVQFAVKGREKQAPKPARFKVHEYEQEGSGSALTSNTSGSGVISSSDNGEGLKEGSIRSGSKAKDDDTWEMISSAAADSQSIPKPKKFPSTGSGSILQDPGIKHRLRYAGDLGDRGRDLGALAMELLRRDCTIGTTLEHSMTTLKPPSPSLKVVDYSLAMSMVGVETLNAAISAAEAVLLTGGQTRETAEVICQDLSAELDKLHKFQASLATATAPANNRQVLLRLALSFGRMAAQKEATDSSSPECHMYYQHGQLLLEVLASTHQLAKADLSILKGYLALFAARVNALRHKSALTF